ncbi:glycosyltransferase family 2 protein [Sulfurisoma sediminicola]|uniref:Glycosyl transferase family 2 n=1 Tax=Sulfurisoma sediminicola TaxID=1381557 RepID=A0A497XAT0_9PROT|nr:glycosyltransferase family 2 protein [Sulfurisoma sediminicola]RLJ63666.1 glycosyl transferase family 2 [Sulfurisoma sediminicola]
MPRVGVVLGTCNGARFLGEQLDSVARQSGADWRLLASDDGSVDATLEILNSFAAAWPGRVEVRAGPRLGFARNFLSMLENPGFDASFWAFCDQDDVWHDDKLSHAVGWLATVAGDRPALYCSRTALVDENGTRLGASPDWRRPPDFRNALVQNIASGNTMVFNEAARRLVAGAGAVGVPFHDWWAYLLVAGCGGEVRFDPVPRVSYRLHGENALGPWGGWRAWRHRSKLLADGTYGGWLDENLVALSGMESQLGDAARATLARFRAMRKARGLRRGVELIRSGVFHQSTLGYLGLLVAASLGRLARPGHDDAI